MFPLSQVDQLKRCTTTNGLSKIERHQSAARDGEGTLEQGLDHGPRGCGQDIAF